MTLSSPSRAEGEHPARAAAAVAAALAVMVAGAGLLLAGATAPVGEAGSRTAPAAESVVSAPASDALARSAPAETPQKAKTGEAVAAQPETAPVAPKALFEDALVETEGPAPRLAPRKEAASAEPASQPEAGVRTPSLMRLGGSFVASIEDDPPPFFFASDIEPRRDGAQPLAVAYAKDMGEGPRAVHVTLEKGETFVDAMRRAGVRIEDRNAAAFALGRHQNLRALRPGQEFVLTTAEPNRTIFQLATLGGAPEAHLLSLDFKVDAQNRISIFRGPDGAFEAKKAATELTTRLVSVSGRINGSLYLSAKQAGAPDKVIAQLADMFAYDVDFQREIFGGDEFEAIFEVRYDDEGRLAETGDILYGRLKWRNRAKEKGYYLFASTESGERGDYFDRAGDSARRLLMKTPIDGARLSSGFGMRKHPIHGFNRAHKGLDFAAARGTPIKAAGSGVIERADRYGSFGNYVRIRHANGYKTAYAHLNGFARGIKSGARVTQGDIIGYVGTTGASTGPHLHYEVHLNGQAVNPQNLKIATGVSLRGSELDKFKALRDAVDALRAPPEEPSGLLAQDTERPAAL